MHRQIKAVLLCGMAILASTMTGSMMAQAAHSAGTAHDRFDVAFNNDATYSDLIRGNSFWMNGGSAQAHVRLYHGLGAVADISGAHTANANGNGDGLDMVIAAYGLRYTLSPRHSRCALFGQILAGNAFGFNSIFPATSGTAQSRNSLAVKMGGGINVSVSSHIALRVVEADWLRTQFPNTVNDFQNNLRLGAGVIFVIR